MDLDKLRLMAVEKGMILSGRESESDLKTLIDQHLSILTERGTLQGIKGELERLTEKPVDIQVLDGAWFLGITYPGAYPDYSEKMANGGFEDYTGVQDDDFDDQFPGWTLSGSGIKDATATVHSGSNALKLTQDANKDAAVRQDITVKPGKTYELILYDRGDGTNPPRYRIVDMTHGGVDIIPLTDTGHERTGYTKLLKRFIAPPGCTSVRIWLKGAFVDASVAYFDDVSVKRAASVRPDAGDPVYGNLDKIVIIFVSGSSEISEEKAQKIARRITPVDRAVSVEPELRHFIEDDVTIADTITYGIT